MSRTFQGLFVFIFVALVACDGNSDRQTEPTYVLGLFVDPEVQSEYLNLLESEGISHEVLDGPTIRIPIHQLAKTLKLKRHFSWRLAFGSDELDPNVLESFSIFHKNESKKNRYVERLKEANVELTGVEHRGLGKMLDESPFLDLWVITYERSYSEKVDLIRQEVELEFWGNAIDSKKNSPNKRMQSDQVTRYASALAADAGRYEEPK